MIQSVKLLIVSVQILKSFHFDHQNWAIGGVASRSILLSFEGHGVLAEVLIPIDGQNDPVKIDISHDENVKKPAAVELLEQDGSPMVFSSATGVLWESTQPIALLN